MIFPIMITYTNVSPTEFEEMTPSEIVEIFKEHIKKKENDLSMKKSELEVIRTAVTLGIANTRKGNRYSLFEKEKARLESKEITADDKEKEMCYLNALLQEVDT